jgi:Domain of unknown function (DUF4326)/AAA domain
VCLGGVAVNPERMDPQEFVDWLSARMDGPDEQTAQENGAGGNSQARPENSSSGAPTDAEILEKCRSSQNSAKFAALYDEGDVFAYHDGDDSRADLGLLGMLAFYSQDPAQLERIFDASRLAQRDKWKRRPDYRERTIKAALSEVRETYNWQLYRYRYSNRGSNGKAHEISSISLAEQPEPEKPEEVWEDAIFRGWPALIYGATGVTKSVTALALARAIACPETHVFLGRDVITAPTMYADFELDAGVQGRRAYHIARGQGRHAPPVGLRYISTYGIPLRERPDFLSRVLEECITHACEVVFLDSIGRAVEGNPGDVDVIIDFFDDVLARFMAKGITPVLLDHQRRLQAGERNQVLGAYGTVWKDNLVRTQAQLELVSRDREKHTVTTRYRPKKASLGELPEPFGILASFSENAIRVESIELAESERAQEDTISAPDRVLAALRTVESAGPQQLAEMTQLAVGTVRKELSALRNTDPPKIVDTGEAEGTTSSRKVRIASFTVTDPYKGNGNGKAVEDPRFSSVAELFADPPGLFAAQLGEYYKNPERHFRAVCVAVTAMTREEGTPWQDVAEEVRGELVRRILPTVVNIHSGEPWDEYAGREYRKRGFDLDESDWHNPHIEGVDGTRAEVIEMYERYLTEERPDLMRRLPELWGKRIGCHCSPKPCHVDVIIKLIAERASFELEHEKGS